MMIVLKPLHPGILLADVPAKPHPLDLALKMADELLFDKKGLLFRNSPTQEEPLTKNEVASVVKIN